MSYLIKVLGLAALYFGPVLLFFIIMGSILG